MSAWMAGSFVGAFLLYALGVMTQFEFDLAKDILLSAGLTYVVYKAEPREKINP